ncbi:exostosin domain-containing protein [Kineococcus sp. SYSU DK018]|uniref:exostosin domain-containing protein n=1 Tax=Kineococcus sp. SYSU DK018 TaxID=3383139 RepID=UPI003D7E92CC
MHAAYYSWFDPDRTPEPVPWDLGDAAAAPVANGRFFAEVLRGVEERLVAADPAAAEGLRGVRVVITPNHWQLPWTGPGVVALLVLDNWSRVPRWADEVGLVLATNRDRAWRDAVGMLPRPLGALELLDEARVRAERRLWRRRAGTRPSGRNVVALPLGYAHQREVPLVPWEERDVDVYFAGSASHGLDKGGALRRAVRRHVGNIKTIHRTRMSESVEHLRAALPELRVRIDLVDGDRAADHADTYSRDMARARFCLDPRGTSRETWRYYEAVRSGTVPVVTSLPNGGLYAGAPAVRLRHWSQLTSAMRHYAAHPEEARALHEECLRWYATVGGPEATAQRLVPHFQRVLTGLPGGR